MVGYILNININGSMLHELIDIFCIGEHDSQLRCLNWIKRLKLHEIMNINSKLYNNYVLICFINKLF